MFVHTIPDEMLYFINRQFIRLARGFDPEPRVINEIGEFVLEYVSKHNYFARVPSEAVWRYEHPQEGLTDMEKLALVGPLEYRLKVQLLLRVDFNQIHLATWAALLWCWSEEGERYVHFVKDSQAAAESLQGQSQLVGFNEACFGGL